MSKVRRYSELVELRVAKLLDRKLAISRVLGTIGGAPMFSLNVPARRPELPVVLISAGVHGDEPAGVLAILEFAASRAARYADSFSFVLFPCINITGFEADSRVTAGGIDLNRSFSFDSALEEIRMVVGELERAPARFACTISLHEDNPHVPCDMSKCTVGPEEFYMYESCLLDSMRIGTRVIDRLRAAAVPICAWENIYGDLNTGGVLRYGDHSNNSTYRGIKDFESFLLQNRTNLSLVTETPVAWQLERRVETQLLAIEAILDEIIRSQEESFVGGGL